MPTLEISYNDLCRLVGEKIPRGKLADALMYAKCEIEKMDGDAILIENKDTNRPDLWSAEGIARDVKGRLVKGGLPVFNVKKSGVVVTVDKKNKSVRPYTVCAVARNIKIHKDILSQLIQLQEKVTGTFGRNRKEVALGVYDLDRIKPPIKFTTVKPDEMSFAPLDYDKKMTPAEILKKHPKGREYAQLLQGFAEYPIFTDSRGEVLSLPPIINSNYSGKVTEKTRNLFIECSGSNLKFLVPALNVIACALADRGASIESVEIIYPDRKMITPNLMPKKSYVSVSRINELSGLGLSTKSMIDLLVKARYGAKLKGDKIEVTYPAYRIDLMHQDDIVEDIIISYGYSNIKPEILRLVTRGGARPLEEFCYAAGDIMISLGFQEILSYTLTNKENLFKKMNLQEEPAVELDNPVSLNWNVFRTWLLPGLMEFLPKNQHVDYPQKIFEIGDTVLIDGKQETGTKDTRKLACAVINSTVSYEEVSSYLDAFMRSLGLDYKLRRASHKPFIEGRCAEILVNNKNIGIIGEIHPQVLENWKLEKPVAAFELDIDEIFKMKK